jgi:pimeloyl-ACP methyl ester carboxylesterase
MKWLALLGLLLVVGCAGHDRDATAEAIAGPAGLRRGLVTTDNFVLTVFTRIATPGTPINVYIEGDGLAWISTYQPSSDPTPRKAMGLSLAAADPAANVAYVARPCQYTPPALNPGCSVAMWTDRRFAPEVVASVSQAIDTILAKGGARGLNLIGYSGGGAVAVLLAARRTDVISIRTVAGNLDHAEVNRLHGVSPMPGSLNAIDEAAQVAKIPQIHFSGGDDATVPTAIAERFRSAAGSSCVAVDLVLGATHESGWLDRWPALLRRLPVCGDGS